jgi:hypothetical protein
MSNHPACPPRPKATAKPREPSPPNIVQNGPSHQARTIPHKMAHPFTLVRSSRKKLEEKSYCTLDNKTTISAGD